MGSLSSRPTVPTVSQVSTQTVTQTPSVSTTTAAEASAVDSEAEESARRAQSLLRQNRGITGTIQTGFRGLLSQSDNADSRKTLLGE